MYRITLVVLVASSLGMSAIGCSDKKDASTKVVPKIDDTHKGIALLPVKIDAAPLRAEEPPPCSSDDKGPGAAHLKLGKAHLENRDAEDAKAAIDRAISLDPKNALAHFELGLAHGMLGESRDAEESFRLATKLAGSCDDDWIGEAYRQLGYAIRERGGSRRGQRDALQNYLDRVEVEDEKSMEVKKLLIPLRYKRGGDRREIE